MNFYYYRAFITKVYDGDSPTADIDLGFNVTLKNQKIRLYGINTPEVRGPQRDEGIFVRDCVRDLILNEEVILESYLDKSGKYGRWLAMIWLGDLNINEYLVDQELAEINFY